MEIRTERKEEHYRLVEDLLNKFKNKEIGYTEVIDSLLDWHEAELEKERERILNDLFEDIKWAIEVREYSREQLRKEGKEKK